MRNCLLVVLTVLLALSSTSATDSKWGVKIELSKPEYMLHEPVLLDVTVTNNSSEPLETDGLYPANFSSLYIGLTDSKGNQLKYTGIQYTITRTGSGGPIIPAGEQDYGSFNLLELFRPIKSSSGYDVLWQWFPFIPKGTYTVMVEYEGEPSSELTFNVVEPIGQEEEVLRKIEQASKICSLTDTNPSSKMFGEIVRDYPNSVYAERCYYLFRTYADNRAEIKSGLYDSPALYREMLSMYANSAKARDWMIVITMGMNDDEETEMYDKLIEDHPDTRASKFASLLKKRLLASKENK